MNNKKTTNLEAVLRTHSLTSEDDSVMLWELISQTSEFENISLEENEERFLSRFSGEKTFNEIVGEAMEKEQFNLNSLCQNLSIPVSILEKILNFTALPNTMPIKKMLLLLTLLHIPLNKAANSINTSLKHFTLNRPIGSSPVLSRRQSKNFPFYISNVTQSKESLKRDIDIYIKRLLEEGAENE